MRKVLSTAFFARPTLTVAPELIGKFLVRRINDTEIASMITETEAYDGFQDKASHASRGITPRNEIMFGDPGMWYVYFTYGMHFMLNIVTRERGYPAAVLFRGTEAVSGPGRLTKYFRIDKKLNTMHASKKSGLWIEDRGVVIPRSKIKRTPRIGIDSSGPVWSKKHWRFVLSDT
jgi:DNA-3-methyladenine glycosylase